MACKAGGAAAGGAAAGAAAAAARGAGVVAEGVRKPASTLPTLTQNSPPNFKSACPAKYSSTNTIAIIAQSPIQPITVQNPFS